MSISRPSTCKWSERTAGTLSLAFLALVLTPTLWGEPAPASVPATFLETFQDTRDIAVVVRDVRFPSAVGTVTAYLARPDTTERLPALLLLTDEGALTGWMKDNARDLAGIGYVVLAVDLQPARLRLAGKKGAAAQVAKEQVLADLSAAERWLRRRPDVQAKQVGVVGWGWGSEQALALAATSSLQACVICDAPLTAETAELAGLRGMPLLGIFGGKDRAAMEKLLAFRKALTAAQVPHTLRVHPGAATGFMGPTTRKTYAHEASERAWVEMYEFLGKHVEDAELKIENGPADQAVATIADLMQAVNQPTGVRGILIAALEKEPATERAWRKVRANAALIVETGRLLERRHPGKGKPSDWLKEARAFTAAAESIVIGADRHDYASARDGLRELGKRCASCHGRHR